MTAASVYGCYPEEGYEWVFPRRKSDRVAMDALDGAPRLPTWHPVPVELPRMFNDGVVRKPADLPWCNSETIVLGERAMSALGPLLSEAGELLPLQADDRNLWIFNALTVVDALDLERSEVVRFSSGRIMDIVRYVFFAEKVRELTAFKLPQEHSGSLYVGERVVEAAAREGLRGTIFKRVWSQEEE